MATAELKVRIDAETGQLKQGLNDANQKLGTFASKANNSIGGFARNTSALMGTVAASIAGAFSVGAVIGFTKEVFNATAQFQKFEAVLGNTLGSSALAGLKLKEIQEFAAKTPFGVNELTNSFVKLAGAGFKPTGDEMRKLGDLASSTGKSFDQLSEAIIDAQTGEFERLKEFNIRAQDAGDKVIFTFKGVQTQVDKSSSAIREYITALGDTQGVAGASAVIAETLTGKISNLGDSWDQMLISIGSNTSGVFGSVISTISKAIDEITEFNRELEIASKFKIGGSFIETLAKFGGKGLGAGGAFGGLLSTKDIKVEAIQAVESGVNKIVLSTIQGAKTATEFGNAIAKLKTEGDQLLKSGGGGDKQVQAAFKSIYEDGIKALQDGRKAFQAELNRPKDAGFGKGKTEQEGKTEAEKLEEEKNKRAQLIVAEGKAFAGQLELLKISNSVAQSIENQTNAQDEFNKGLEEATLIGEKFQADIFGKKLIEPVQSFGDFVKGDILPQLGSSFKTFFDEILMRGEWSFAALGKSILNTFASVLANQATTGVLALLGDKEAQAKGNVFSTVAKELGIAGKGGKGGGILGLLGIGGAGAAAGAVTAGSLSGVAATTGGVILGAPIAAAGTAGLGTAGAAAGATAASGGLLLPILGGIAAGALVASLFKKKQPAQPQPAFTTSNAISTSSSSNVDFGNGRVVFEISGVNLVGVLNRAGAKLQRFGP
jgi:hypothetical protein